MRKTVFSIEREVETVRRDLLPSKVLVLHMWRPGDPPSETSKIEYPTDDPQHNMAEQEIIAQGLREHRRVIIVPYKFSEKPNQSELKQYLESMAKEEGAKKE